ncbi:hypothetical protein [Macrococcus brunensis]|uniref:hypothetical protein n=1 Tax=Macrococcus brunensis TaxID=198483 RepID=UPI001409FCC5|nr:hypothetical protein [Macrococcus brunensis]
MLKILKKLFSKKDNDKKNDWPPKHSNSLSDKDIERRLDDVKYDANKDIQYRDGGDIS